MIIECGYCGAPLDIERTGFTIKCSYCGRRSLLRRSGLQSAGTTNTVEAAHSNVHTTTPLPPPRVLFGLFAAGLLSLIGGLTLLLVLGVFSSKVERWDRRSTLSCGFQEELLIENLEASVAHGPVIRAGLACHVTIRNSRLRGSVIVHATGANVEVTIENSTLQATDKAIRGDDNFRLSVTGDSRIQGRNAAVATRSNAIIVIRGSTLFSERDGILSGNNLSLTVQEGTIDGGEFGIRAGSMRFTMTDSRIRGRQFAVQVLRNARGTVTSTRFDGPTEWGVGSEIHR